MEDKVNNILLPHNKKPEWLCSMGNGNYQKY